MTTSTRRCLENDSVVTCSFNYLEYYRNICHALIRMCSCCTCNFLCAAASFTLANEVRAKRKYNHCDTACPPRPDAALAGLPKRSKPTHLSKLRCRVGISGETERKQLIHKELRIKGE